MSSSSNPPIGSQAPVQLSLGSLYARLICVPVIWGGTFIAGRISSQHLPPAVSALGRYVFALLALLLAWRWLEGQAGWRGLQITRRQASETLALGLTGILAYNLFFFSALAILPASRTSVIVALNPAITIIFSALFLHERMQLMRWLGVVLALVGVWIVVTRGELSALVQSMGKGELLMFGAVCSWAAYTLMGKRVLGSLSALKATL